MNNSIKKPIVFVIYLVGLCMAFQVNAQTPTTKTDTVKSDVVYLKDGSIFRGSIVKYYPNATLKMRIAGGSKVLFHSNDIERIVQGNADWNTNPKKEERAKALKEFAFPTEGFTHRASLNFLNGTAPWFDQYVLGVGLNYTLGYQLNENYNVGIGSGIDYYYLEQREMLIPLYVQAKRSFDWKPNFQPFIMMEGGYGFALTSENQNISAAKGGFMYHPAIGVAFGSSKDYHWQLDAGIRWQQADFTFENQWNPTTTTTHEMTYKRFAVRWSLAF